MTIIFFKLNKQPFGIAIDEEVTKKGFWKPIKVFIMDTVQKSIKFWNKNKRVRYFILKVLSNTKQIGLPGYLVFH